jgi:uncharacterized protein (DUF305 family)
MNERMQLNHYGRLAAMSALSFMAMYVLMYAMVDAAGDVYNNVNQIYMAGLMTAPMIIIELVLMRGMFQNRRLNVFIAGTAVAAGVVCFALLRQQTAVSDAQFLRSMIPHHSGAILTCEEAPIRNASVQELCRTIVSSQEAEIAQMRELLRDLDR